jgi:hypothetical protein
MQVVALSLAPQAKPFAGSRVTKVKRFLRFAGTVAAQGRNQGFSTRQSRCRQHKSTMFARASQPAARSEPFALVNELHLAESPPAAAVSHRLGGTKRSPIFAPAAVPPNPSLKLTRYGRHCKPGLSHSHYRLRPGLQYLPTRAA